jgi:hypothetical protein
MLQLSIETVYHCEHSIEIMPTATNDHYSGTISIFMCEDGQELIGFGSQLNWFPKSIVMSKKKRPHLSRQDKAEFQEMIKTHPPN